MGGEREVLKSSSPYPSVLSSRSPEVHSTAATVPAILSNMAAGSPVGEDSGGGEAGVQLTAA